MLKKLFAIIGGIVVVGALAVGGYFVYKKYIEKNVGEFKIIYKYEQIVEGLGEYHVYVKGYTGKSPENVVIANTFTTDMGEKPVYGMRMNAFKDNTTMKTIDMPQSLTYFESSVFSGCSALEAVTLRAAEPLLLVFSNSTLSGLDLTKITFKVANNDMGLELRKYYPTLNYILIEE